MSIEAKLVEKGIELPAVPQPVAAYVPGVRAGNLVFTSGQLPAAGGEVKFKGKVGADVTVEDGYEAAKLCALNCLAVVKSLVGNLDRVKKIVKVTGFVNSTPDFEQQPQVINGASEFLVDLLGEVGKHSRAAVGVSSLPLGVPCEVEMIVEVQE